MINTLGFFEGIFKHAVENSILILDVNGKILDVNKGFMNAFGYKKSELVNKNFEILFTDADRADNKPMLEIKAALLKGAKSDNNYLLNKEGLPIWVLGESLSATNDAGAVDKVSTTSGLSLYSTAGATQTSSTATLKLNFANNGDSTDGVITFDATNIIITWTKTGTPTGVYQLLWQAE